MKILKVIAKPFTLLAGKVDHAVQAKVVSGVVRHIAGAIGAILLAHGYLSESALPQFTQALIDLIGALLLGNAIGSSVVQKIDAAPKE